MSYSTLESRFLFFSIPFYSLFPLPSSHSLLPPLPPLFYQILAVKWNSNGTVLAVGGRTPQRTQRDGDEGLSSIYQVQFYNTMGRVCAYSFETSWRSIFFSFLFIILFLYSPLILLVLYIYIYIHSSASLHTQSLRCSCRHSACVV